MTLKVLIADDEQLITKLVINLGDWERLGMEVVGTAENGLDAIELVKKHMPQIMITDIRMPGCTGLELIEQAKQIRPDIEVIIISGYAHFEYAQTAIRYGVGNYLLKPINRDELNETLEKIREKILSAKEEKRLSDAGEMVSRLKQGLVKDLVSGHYHSETNEQFLKTYHIDPGRGDFAVVLLAIDSEKEISAEAESLIHTKLTELLVQELDTFCMETLLYFHDAYGYLLLQFISENKTDIRRKLRECINTLSARKEMYGIVEITLGLGSVVSDPDDLPQSLQAACEMIDERLLEGTWKVLEVPVHASGLHTDSFLSSFEQTIEKYFSWTDEGALKEGMELVHSYIADNERLSGHEILQLIEKCALIIAGLAYKDEENDLLRAFLNRASRTGHLKQLLELFDTYAEEVGKIAIEDRDHELTKPVRSAQQYVMQHYAEPITLEDVCEYVGFSVSYFSALFKKETGEGFLKYLTKVRMEEAKTQLRETDASVVEICENIGYSDRKHFTHTFKKYTGLNPAEYRKIYG